MRNSILHIVDTLSVGGTEILLKNTIPHLGNYDHVICYMGGSTALASSFSGYPLYSLGFNSKTDLLICVRKLKKIIRQHQVQLIHSHLFWSTLAARLAKPRGVKMISTIHSILSKDAFEKNRLSYWAEKWSANRQDEIIAVSEFALRDYLDFIPFKGKTHVLYNFIPDDFFQHSETPVFPEGEMKCVAVGNIKAVKNYPFIISAFRELADKSFSLDVFGEGPSKKELEISSAGLKVKFAGSQNKLNELLPRYHVFLQMSLYEGFGIALFEAMASGLVPVLSDIPVHREVAEDCAYYVNLADSSALAAVLISLKNDKEGYLEKQKKSLERARMISSRENYLLQLNKIYKDLI